MELRKKIKIIFEIGVILLLMLSVKSFASSLSISTSQSSVSAGGSFTATITGNDAIGKVNISVSNGTASSSSVWVDGSENITVTAGSSGTVTITATGSEMSDSSGNDISNPSASASVGIASSSSSNTSTSTSTTTSETSTSTTTTTSDTSTSAPTLSNLGITPYDFSGFKSGTTSYSVTVPNSCTSVTIYATTSSTGATISGTGAVTLKEGTNKYTVTVSNSAGSKSYTLSIIRQSEESEIIANTSDEEVEEAEETTEEVSEGIGLAGLRITGYELDPEFETTIYEYTVTVDEELTLDDLEEIKSHLTAITNSDEVYTETTAEISEDGIATITVVVKDDEREYSRYVITFEVEETTVAIAGTTKTNNSSSETEIPDVAKKILGLMICLWISILLSVYFAISSYVKGRKLAKYEPKDYNEEDDEEENIVESIMNERKNEFEGLKVDMASYVDSNENGENYKLTSDMDSMQIEKNDINNLQEDEIEEKSKVLETVAKTAEKIEDLGGYRKLRKNFGSSGKH